jgi:hypothetical protein
MGKRPPQNATLRENHCAIRGHRSCAPPAAVLRGGCYRKGERGDEAKRGRVSQTGPCAPTSRTWRPGNGPGARYRRVSRQWITAVNHNGGTENPEKVAPRQQGGRMGWNGGLGGHAGQLKVRTVQPEVDLKRVLSVTKRTVH